MSHEITIRTDGTEEMAYTGQRPWHGLGVEVDHPMTASEAIELAGLDWEVSMEPVYMRSSGAKDGFLEIPGKQALVRVDTKEVFNVFSKTYRPVQNRDAFTFFDGVVGSGEAIYETAGSLKGGRRVWILAKLPGDLKLDDKDILEKYILLANSHDGTMQVTMKITPIRVVCNNTLELATMSDGKQVQFRHTTNVLNRMNDTREFLGLTEAYFELFMQQCERLAEAKFSEGQVREVAKEALNSDPRQEDSKARKAAVDQIVALYYTGTGSELVTANGTGWGAVNALTEFIDHKWPVAGSKSRDPNVLTVADRRLAHSWFGVGAAVRQRGWDKALQLAG